MGLPDQGTTAHVNKHLQDRSHQEKLGRICIFSRANEVICYNSGVHDYGTKNAHLRTMLGNPALSVLRVCKKNYFKPFNLYQDITD